jgi:RNA polymerase primary sigma factor
MKTKKKQTTTVKKDTRAKSSTKSKRVMSVPKKSLQKKSVKTTVKATSLSQKKSDKKTALIDHKHPKVKKNTLPQEPMKALEKIIAKEKISVSKAKKKTLADDNREDRMRELTPMRIYLNQIEHIPLLTPNDELELSKKIQEKEPDWKEARRRMIRSNLRLVINIAKRYMNIGLPFSDLVEEGNIGLMRAVDKFNYERGYRFSTYASWWIKQSIMRALSNQGKLIRIPVHMFETMNRWRKVREYLIQKDGRIPTHKEIAKVMKIKPEKVKEIEQVASTSPSSLNAPVSLEGDAELIDLIEDETHKMPHEEAHHVFKGQRINELLQFVNERERTILILRFGLDHNDTHTLEETAQQFGITRERVRQIEEAALKKIRYQLSLQDDKLENYI